MLCGLPSLSIGGEATPLRRVAVANRIRWMTIWILVISLGVLVVCGALMGVCLLRPGYWTNWQHITITLCKLPKIILSSYYVLLSNILKSLFMLYLCVHIVLPSSQTSVNIIPHRSQCTSIISTCVLTNLTCVVSVVAGTALPTLWQLRLFAVRRTGSNAMMRNAPTHILNIYSRKFYGCWILGYCVLFLGWVVVLCVMALSNHGKDFRLAFNAPPVVEYWCAFATAGILTYVHILPYPHSHTPITHAHSSCLTSDSGLILLTIFTLDRERVAMRAFQAFRTKEDLRHAARAHLAETARISGLEIAAEVNAEVRRLRRLRALAEQERAERDRARAETSWYDDPGEGSDSGAETFGPQMDEEGGIELQTLGPLGGSSESTWS